MWYEIVKRITYNEKENNFSIYSKSSNDDIWFKTWNCIYINKNLKNIKDFTEREKMYISIFEAYIKWNFQKWNNIFTEALKDIQKDEKFKKVYWKINEYKFYTENRKKMWEEKYYKLIWKYILKKL